VETLTLTEFPDSISNIVQKAFDLLSQGKVIIAPTETTYGLLADATNVEAVHEIYRLKKRTSLKTMAIFVKSSEELSSFAYVRNEQLNQAICELWPGPVTFILKAKVDHWDGILSEKKTIGFRCSNHQFIKLLADVYGKPLTATSANISGQNINSEDELLSTFEDKIDLCVFDPLLNFDSKTSTVVDLSQDKIEILREGKIPNSKIEETFNNVKF